MLKPPPPPRVSQVAIAGFGFGRVGPNGEPGVTITLRDKSGRGYKLGRMLSIADLEKLRDTADKFLKSCGPDLVATPVSP
jgi:hypothetical protein